MIFQFQHINDGIVACFSLAFGAMMITGVLKPKKKRLWPGWAVLGAAVFLATGIYYGLYDQVVKLVEDYEALRGGEVTQLGNIVLTLCYFIKDIIPGIAVIAGAVALYEEEVKEKLFTAILALLVGEIVLNVFCEITNMPFYTEIVEEKYIYPPPLIRDAIIVFWMGVSLILFHRLVKIHFLKILDRIKGEVGKFLKLPIASYVLFVVVMAANDLLSINFRSTVAGNVFVASIVIIGMTGMYLFMYSALFNAIFISADAAKVRADLEVASHIQRSALPAKFPAFPDRKEIDIFASMRPAREVGGDFYDFFFIDEEHLGLVIADVSGKGVPAALFMMSGKTTIRNQAMAGLEPGDVLNRSNRQLVENNEQELFITAFFAVLNVKNGLLRFSNAGHNTPFICKPDGTVEGVKMRPGFVLGGMEGIRYRTQELQLEPGDKLLLYTDGVTEANDVNWELYGEKRLQELMSACGGDTPRKLIDKVNGAVDEFAGGTEQADDITMLAVTYLGVASAI